MVDRSKGRWPLGPEFEHGPSVLLPHVELTGSDPYRVVRVRDVAVGPRLPAVGVYGQINVYGVTTKSERHKRSYWTRTADGNGIGGRKAPVPYGS